jgi:plastocyanin
MMPLHRLSFRFARKFRFAGFIVATIGLTCLMAAIAQSYSESIHRPAIPRTQIAAAQSVTVTIEGFQFKPNVLTVKRGTTVMFINNDAVPHTVTPEKGAKFTGTGRLQKNDSKQVTFNQVGTQHYFCEIHPSMKGQITVIN